MNIGTDLIPLTKVSQKKAADQTVKYKIIHFLEVNARENLGYLQFGDNVLDTVLKVQCIKEIKFVLY